MYGMKSTKQVATFLRQLSSNPQQRIGMLNDGIRGIKSTSFKHNCSNHAAGMQSLFSPSLMRLNNVYADSSSRFFSTSPSNKFENEPAEKEPLQPSLIDKYQLNEPSRWVPLSLGAFGTAVATGLLHLNEEVQLLGLFILFSGTVYTQGGKMIGDMFEETAQAVLKEHNAIEDLQIESTKQAIDAHKRQMSLHQDIETILNAQKHAIDAMVSTQALRLKHEMRDIIERRVKFLVEAEEAAAASLQRELVKGATDSAIEAFRADDEEFQTEFLESAIQSLEDLEQPQEEDLVAAEFQGFFDNFRSDLEEAQKAPIELSDEEHADVMESVNAALRREGLEKINVSVPRKVSLGSLA